MGRREVILDCFRKLYDNAIDRTRYTDEMSLLRNFQDELCCVTWEDSWCDLMLKRGRGKECLLTMARSFWMHPYLFLDIDGNLAEIEQIIENSLDSIADPREAKQVEPVPQSTSMQPIVQGVPSLHHTSAALSKYAYLIPSKSVVKQNYLAV